MSYYDTYTVRASMRATRLAMRLYDRFAPRRPGQNVRQWCTARCVEIEDITHAVQMQTHVAKIAAAARRLALPCGNTAPAPACTTAEARAMLARLNSPLAA